uniref:Uncharacterized protein n=1 Tax=Aegilops tauschii TaxID=37682 RepID=M8ASP6_AEGTA
MVRLLLSLLRTLGFVSLLLRGFWRFPPGGGGGAGAGAAADLAGSPPATWPFCRRDGSDLSDAFGWVQIGNYAIARSVWFKQGKRKRWVGLHRKNEGASCSRRRREIGHTEMTAAGSLALLHTAGDRSPVLLLTVGEIAGAAPQGGERKPALLPMAGAPDRDAAAHSRGRSPAVFSMDAKEDLGRCWLLQRARGEK